MRAAATDVLSGERADDGLYIPIIQRIEAGLSSGGLLFVGDCMMSALATRAYMAGRQHGSLAPLPRTGGTAEAMARGIDEGSRARPGGRPDTYHAGQSLVAKRCAWHRAMRWRDPVRWRSVPRSGANGSWWCARPSMRPTRRWAWKNVWCRRSTSWRPSPQLAGGANASYR